MAMTPTVDATSLQRIPAVRSMADRLFSGLEAEAVYLFGSMARGDESEDSDVDLLVVVPQSSEPRYRRGRQARRLVSDFKVPKDIVVLTSAEWHEELEVKASLAATVAREGVLLNGG